MNSEQSYCSDLLYRPIDAYETEAYNKQFWQQTTIAGLKPMHWLGINYPQGNCSKSKDYMIWFK